MNGYNNSLTLSNGVTLSGSRGKGEEIKTLTVKWNDDAADYVYTLNVLIEYPNGERIAHRNSTSGGIKWAERIAKHYNLEIPEEPTA